MVTTKAVGGVVDSPTLSPAPFGLIGPETLVKDADRWEGGVAYESLACAATIDLWDLCDPDGTTVVDGTGKDREVIGTSFGITATDVCKATFGADFRTRAAERALALLEASTQKAVESELMWGHVASAATPVGRWLTSTDTTTIGASAVPPRAALALLEDAYAACGYGGAGVIHMTRGTVAALGELVLPDGEVLRTRAGTLVIAGAGYTAVGTPPEGWTGTWAFITGPTQVWLGEASVFPEDNPAIDISVNDIRYRAERLAAVTFDGCCAYAVKVDLAQA